MAGAAWGQVDSLLTLLLVFTVLTAIKGQWIAALPIYVLAVLVKPQALMFGPIGLAALIMDLAMHKDKQRRISTLWGAGISALVALVIVLPFVTAMEQPLAWLVKLYSGTMTFYGQATVNATNLYFLFGLNWVPVGDNAGWLLRLAGALAVLVPVAIYMLRARLAQAIAVGVAAGGAGHCCRAIPRHVADGHVADGGGVLGLCTVCGTP